MSASGVPFRARSLARSLNRPTRRSKHVDYRRVSYEYHGDETQESQEVTTHLAQHLLGSNFFVGAGSSTDCLFACATSLPAPPSQAVSPWDCHSPKGPTKRCHVAAIKVDSSNKPHDINQPHPLSQRTTDASRFGSRSLLPGTYDTSKCESVL